MTWEPVRRAQARVEANQPRIRISNGHEVVVSLAAIALLGDPGWVRLWCDPDRNLLALAATDGSEPDSFRLTGSGTGRRFSTVALARRFGVGKQRQEFMPRLESARLIFGPYEHDAPSREQVRAMVAAANGTR